MNIINSEMWKNEQKICDTLLKDFHLLEFRFFGENLQDFLEICKTFSKCAKYFAIEEGF